MYNVKKNSLSFGESRKGVQSRVKSLYIVVVFITQISKPIRLQDVDPCSPVPKKEYLLTAVKKKERIVQDFQIVNIDKKNKMSLKNLSAEYRCSIARS